MPITMYAYSAADAEESDPDELFVVTTDDPAAVLAEHFSNATFEFLYEDEHTNEWVFDVWDGDHRIASLYTSEA